MATFTVDGTGQSCTGGVIELTVTLTPDSPVPVPPDPPDWEPDAICDGDEIVAQLKAWAADWAGTVSEGKTEADPRVLAVRSGDWDSWTVKGLSFPVAVAVVSGDRDALGARFSRVVLESCENLLVGFVEISRDALDWGGSEGLFNMESCSRCGLAWSNVHGPEDETCSIKNFGVMYEKGSDNFLIDNLITDCPVGFCGKGQTRLLRIGNVYDYMKGDDLKMAGSDGTRSVNEWSSLHKRGWNPDDHTDFWQEQGEDGCPPYDGYDIDGAIIFQNTPDDRSFQGLFFGGNTKHLNYHIYNSVVISSNGNVKGCEDPEFGDPSNVVENLISFYPPPAGFVSGDPTPNTSLAGDGAISRLGGTVRNNLTTRFDKVDPANLGEGTIMVPCGPSGTDAHYDGQHEYLTGPITRDDDAERSPMARLTPVAGSPAHWDHPEPVGAYARLKAILLDGVHPGNSPNKRLADHWQSAWNWDGAAR